MVSNHVRDLIRRYGADGSVVPKALTDYVPDETDYDYDEHSRVGAKHGAFVSDEICDRFCVLGTPEQAVEKLARARVDRRRPVQHLPDDRGPGGDPRDLRAGDHPALRRSDGGSMRKLIRGGTVVTASRRVGRRRARSTARRSPPSGRSATSTPRSIDADGCYVLPGLIDNHTHMAMPFGGTRSIDDYDTGTRAAAAGGTTCIVDFVIQQQAGGLRSSLDEWQERAAGAAHVDYGFHMAITQADEGTFADMAPMVEEGIARFKVFLAYKGVLMVTDDLFFRVLETTRDLNALTMVHCENGWAIDVLVERALAAGQTDPIHHAHTRPEILEAEATAPLRAARRARRRERLHRPRHLRAGGRRDRRREGARRARLRRDVPAVPDQHDRRPRAPGLRGRALRLLAAAARAAQPGAAVGRAADAACSRASRPTTARSTASRRRSAATTSRRSPTAWR